MGRERYVSNPKLLFISFFNVSVKEDEPVVEVKNGRIINNLSIYKARRYISVTFY